MNSISNSIRFCGNRVGQRGLTLVELMVSLVLGLILLGSAIQVYQGNRQTFRTAESLARVQENGRIALETITKDLRMVGQLGCGSRRVLLNSVNYFKFVRSVTSDSPPPFDPTYQAADKPVQVFDNSTAWSGPVVPTDGTHDLTVCDDVDGGNSTCQVSDAIAITHGSESSSSTLTAMASASSAIPIRKSDFDMFSGDNDLYLISDCRNGDLFRGAAAHAGNTTNITPDANLSRAYAVNATVMPLTGSIYFVGHDGGGVPGLYRVPLFDEGVFPDAQLIAPGIEGMQVMIGLDTTGDDSLADEYRAPADVAADEWPRAATIRVSILIKSTEDNVTDTPTQVRFFDGTADDGEPGFSDVNTGDDADRRLRMSFTTTIALRNHMP